MPVPWTAIGSSLIAATVLRALWKKWTRRKAKAPATPQTPPTPKLPQP